MRDLKELTTNELKNAIWDLNDGRCPGPIVPDIQAIRQELIRRGESPSGYHELGKSKNCPERSEQNEL